MRKEREQYRAEQAKSEGLSEVLKVSAEINPALKNETTYSGCFITGTDTDIGKTFITAPLFRAGLLQGRKVAAIKSVQTGVPAFDTPDIAEDAAVYRNATVENAIVENVTVENATVENVTVENAAVENVTVENVTTEQVSPPIDAPIDTNIVTLYRFSMPCSPHLAARLEGKEISIKEILNEIKSIQRKGYFTLIEPPGGLYVPLNENETNLDLIQQTHLPVLLVFANRVGCINHVLLSLSELRRRNIPVLGLISNETVHTAAPEYDIIRKDNIATLENISGIEVLAAIPFFEKKDEKKNEKKSEKNTDTWNAAAEILASVWEKL